MTGNGSVAAVILAAGESRRMGSNKMLIDLGGRSLVRHSVTTAAEAGLDPIVVVTGSGAAELERELARVDCVLVHNAEHAEGMHTSIGVGIRVLPRSVEGTVVMLADMPFVTSSMLRALVATRAAGARLVVSRYGGEIEAPPFLYGRELFGELSRMRGRCGSEVIRRHRDEVRFADWPRDALQDIDTPGDVDLARARLAGAPAGG